MTRVVRIATISAVHTNQRVIIGVLTVLLLVVAAETLIPRAYKPEPEEQIVQEPCEGEAIIVDFAYTGAINDPWTCQVQCQDDRPRYILYTNGKATQCETPPGCNDIGEDTGVTCEAPAETPATAF